MLLCNLVLLGAKDILVVVSRARRRQRGCDAQAT